MRNENLSYEADRLTMHGRLFWDEKPTNRRPGVLVFPEGLGINDHTYEFAERLAEQGYVALACDFYGDAYTSKTGDLDEETIRRLGELKGDIAKVRIRAKGAFDALTARPEVNKGEVAAIGYCFGGTTALELACAGMPLAAAVGFHCGLDGITVSDAKNISGRILVCLGSDDPWVPSESRHKFEAYMSAANVNWQVNLYGGVVHSFTNKRADKLGNSKRARYDEHADKDSWSAMLRLFNDVFRS